jgi:hypothetical protein
MGLQMLIIPNKKLYILITYMVLAPNSMDPSGRTACPPLEPALIEVVRSRGLASTEGVNTLLMSCVRVRG